MIYCVNCVYWLSFKFFLIKKNWKIQCVLVLNCYDSSISLSLVTNFSKTPLLIIVTII